MKREVNSFSRKGALAALILCVALGATVIAGCSPQSAGTSDNAAVEAVTSISYPDEMQSNVSETMEKATPSEDNVLEKDSGFLPGTDFATEFIDAGNRGCNSCHDDFYSLIKNYPGHMQHIQFTDAGYGKTFTINDCMPCHISNGYMGGIWFDDAIHAAHRNNPGFEAMGGDCWSCHALKGDGEMVLWDQYKYDAALGGYDNSASERMQEWSGVRGYDGQTVAGVTVLDSLEFENVSIDQRLADDEDIFEAVNAEFPDLNADNYVLEVTGGVNNPRSFTLDELKELGSVTKNATLACQGNPLNGVQIANRQWEGVLIESIIDACGGLQEGINGAFTYCADEFTMGRSKGVQYLIDSGAMLAWACNGEELAPEEGYPVRLVYPGQGGATWTKYVNHIDFFQGDVDSVTDDNFVYAWNNEEVAATGMNIYNMIYTGYNAAWVNPGNDEQVYKLGDTITLEGWAWCFVSRDQTSHYTSAIQFSADYGEHWTVIDLPEGTDPYQWNYFTVDWTPPKAGTYVLHVQPVDAGGWETEYQASVIIKVEE